MGKLAKTIVLLLLLAIMAAPLSVLAAGESVTVEIPFTVKGADGTVVMEVSKDAPGPQPQQAVFDEAKEGTFRITFTEPGEYLYTVYQRKGTNENVEYDTITVYLVGVIVSTGRDGKLTASVGVNKKGDNVKKEVMEFTNVPTYAYLEIVKLAKSDGKVIDDLFSGNEFLYEITVENVGDAPATDVVITDVLPEESPLLTVGTINNFGKMSEDKKSISWNVETIFPGQKVTVSFTVYVPPLWGETTWVNTAAAIYGGGFSLDGSSGSTMTATSTATATVTAPEPEVIMEKEQSLNGGPRTKERIQVKPGDTITYYVTLTNNSESTAYDVIVTDEVPKEPKLLQLIATSISDNGEETAGTITWNLGDLGTGKSVTVSFEITVPEVSEYSLWTNQAYGSYLPVSSLARAGRAADKVDLLSNFVEAEYIPEGTPPEDSSGSNDSSKPEDSSTPSDNSTSGNTSKPNESSPSDSAGSSGDVNSVETGDNNYLGIAMILMIGSLAGLVVFYFTGKRKYNE